MEQEYLDKLRKDLINSLEYMSVQELQLLYIKIEKELTTR